MPNVNQEGKYLGYISSKCVTRSKNGYATFEADLELHEELKRGSGYAPLPQKLRIKAFLMLTCQSGVNSKQVEALKGALGWDGKSLKALNEIECGGIQVQVVISHDPENQNYPYRVDWINAPSKDRSMPPADLDKLDAEFQALLGSAPVGVGERHLGIDEAIGPGVAAAIRETDSVPF